MITRPLPQALLTIAPQGARELSDDLTIIVVGFARLILSQRDAKSGRRALGGDRFGAKLFE
jgi:hypothetical protein